FKSLQRFLIYIQSTSPHSRAASSARDAQGTPTQSAAHSQMYCFLTRYCYLSRDC
ncbi:hypothetical protein Tco_0457424, partial [Tanacetum coccineum]